MRRALRDGLVRVRLERDDLPPAPGAVGGDQHLRLGVVDPVAERIRAETRRTRPSAELRSARTRASRSAARAPSRGRCSPGRPCARPGAQTVREAADLVQELPVGDRPRVSRLSLPVVRDLVAASGLDVAVEAVVRTRSAFRPNHFTNGGVHSITVSQRRIHSAGSACSAQNASGSSARALVDRRIGDRAAPSTKPGGGGNTRFSWRSASMCCCALGHAVLAAPLVLPREGVDSPSYAEAAGATRRATGCLHRWARTEPPSCVRAAHRGGSERDGGREASSGSVRGVLREVQGEAHVRGDGRHPQERAQRRFRAPVRSAAPSSCGSTGRPRRTVAAS